MKLPFLFMKSTETTPSWPWPTCGTPKTLSFRAPGKTHVFNSINEEEEDDIIITHPLDLELEEGEKDSISIEKVVVRGLKSERLFFEPAASDALLDLHGEDGWLIGRFKESVVMAEMDSTDPFVDFRRSMQEMVESGDDHKDWEFLEELLTCYLRVNGKSNHGYIVGAFIDLLVGLALSSSSSSSSHEYDDQYYCSSSSSSSSSCCITTNSFTSPISFSSSSTTFSNTNLEVDQQNTIVSSSSN